MKFTIGQIKIISLQNYFIKILDLKRSNHLFIHLMDIQIKDAKLPVPIGGVHGSILDQEGIFVYRFFPSINVSRALEKFIFDLEITILDEPPPPTDLLIDGWSLKDEDFSFPQDPEKGIAARDKQISDAIEHAMKHTVSKKKVSLINTLGVTPEEVLPKSSPIQPILDQVIVPPPNVFFVVESVPIHVNIKETLAIAQVLNKDLQDMTKYDKEMSPPPQPINLKLGHACKQGMAMTDLSKGKHPVGSFSQQTSGEDDISNQMQGPNKFMMQSFPGSQKNWSAMDTAPGYTSAANKAAVMKEDPGTALHAAGKTDWGKKIADDMTWVGKANEKLSIKKYKTQWKKVVVEKALAPGIQMTIDKTVVGNNKPLYVQMKLIGKFRNVYGKIVDVVYGMKTYELDHLTTLKDFLKPTVPPKITAYTLVQGVNMLSVQQLDPFAYQVVIRRQVKPKGSDPGPWAIAQTMNLTDDMGPEIIQDGGYEGSASFVENTKSNVDWIKYEAIPLHPITNNQVAGTHTEVTVLPIESPVDAPTDHVAPRYNCTIDTELASDGILITVHGLPTSVIRAEVRRENISRKGYYSSTLIGDLPLVPPLGVAGHASDSLFFEGTPLPQEGGLVFKDVNVTPGEVYKYRVFCYDRDAGVPGAGGTYTEAIPQIN